MSQVEQRAHIKLYQKLGKTASETFQMIQQIYGDGALGRSAVFNWYQRFSGGRDSLEDNGRTGRPQTIRTERKIEEVAKLMRANRSQTVNDLAQAAGISYGTCHKILSEDLNMSRVPRDLTQIQRDLIGSVEDHPAFFNRIVTGKPQLKQSGDLDLSDSGAPSVDGNEASDGAGPAEGNDEGSSFSRDDFETCDLSEVKVKVEHTDDFCSEPETKRSRVEEYQEESKLEEVLSILRDLKQSYSASQGPNDRFSLYGQHVANKLRGYSEKTSAIVEHAINNILFEADMGNYDGIHTALPSHDDSVQ